MVGLVKPTLQVSVKGPGGFAVTEPLTKLTHRRAIVGIPASKADRTLAIQAMLQNAKSLSKKKKFAKALSGQINNAELLYIFTHGSPLRNQPPRPVIQPAIMDPDNNKLITEQLELAIAAALDGKDPEVYLKRAGQVAENAARGWFVNGKNGWAPNAPSTIRRKGSNRPGIDLGEMRKAITSFVVEE